MSEQAIARYEQSSHKNHHRLTNRLGGAAVATESIEAVDKVWKSLMSGRWGVQRSPHERGRIA